MVSRVRVITKSAVETKRAAELFANDLAKISPQRSALVLALSGDLGGGKTTFAQGFAKGLGIRESVTSPTFLIARIYPISRGKFRRFVHVDAYRLGAPAGGEKEIRTIGWREWARDPKTIMVVEWAKNIEKLLPRVHFDIHFEFISNTKRRITIHGEGI